MKVTRSELIRVAKLEIREWSKLPAGLAMIILFAYIHRLTTGEMVRQEVFAL